MVERPSARQRFAATTACPLTVRRHRQRTATHDLTRFYSSKLTELVPKRTDLTPKAQISLRLPSTCIKMASQSADKLSNASDREGEDLSDMDTGTVATAQPSPPPPSLPQVDFGDFRAKIVPNKRRSSTTEPVSTHEILTNSVTACINHFDPQLEFSGKNGSTASNPSGPIDKSSNQREKDLTNGQNADKLVSSSIFSLPTLNFEYTEDDITHITNSYTAQSNNSQAPNSSLLKTPKRSNSKRRQGRYDPRQDTLGKYGFRPPRESDVNHHVPHAKMKVSCKKTIDITGDGDPDLSKLPSELISQALDSSHDTTDNNYSNLLLSSHAVSQNPQCTLSILHSLDTTDVNRGINFGNFQNNEIGRNSKCVVFQNDHSTAPTPQTPNRRVTKRHHTSGDSDSVSPKRTRVLTSEDATRVPQPAPKAIEETVTKNPWGKLKYASTRHTPATRIFPQDCDKPDNVPLSDPQNVKPAVPFLDSFNDEERRKWYAARNKATTAEKRRYKGSWVAQSTGGTLLTDWAFGLRPLPPWAIDTEEVQRRVFDIRCRAAQEVMDTVQTHLQKTAGKIKAESDRVLKDLDQVLTLEQQQASKKAVEKHTSDHVAGLTTTLSRRREILILNQPTVNEAITMKSERRAYPTTSQTPSVEDDDTYANLTDLSDEDEEERLAKRKSQARKRVKPTKGKASGMTKKRDDTQAGNTGIKRKTPQYLDDRPEAADNRNAKTKRPRPAERQTAQAEAPAAHTTSRQPGRGRPRPSNRRQNAGRNKPTATTTRGQQGYRPQRDTWAYQDNRNPDANPQWQSYQDDYNVGNEEVPYTNDGYGQSNTGYEQSSHNPGAPFRGGRRGHRGTRSSTRGRPSRPRGRGGRQNWQPRDQY